MKHCIVSLFALTALAALAACDSASGPVAPQESAPLSPDASAAGLADLTGQSVIAYIDNRDASCGAGSTGLGIWLIRPDGTDRTCVTDGTRRDHSPVFSPDGSRIAFSRLHFLDGFAQEDIFVINADGTKLERLTFHRGGDASPTWSPDGTRIAFTTNRENVDNRGGLHSPDAIWQVEVSTGTVTKVSRVKAYITDLDWSPDGTRILYTHHGNVILGESNVGAIALGGNTTSLLTTDGHANRQPHWSPDGSRIAFSSRRTDPSGHNDIFVMDADGSNVTRVTTDPGNELYPNWSPDGARLVFRRDNGLFYELMVANTDGTGVVSLDGLGGGVTTGGPDWRAGAESEPEPTNTAPTAVAGGSYTGVEGEAIAFDGSASSDPEEDPLTFAWTFGDGASSAEASPSHVYADNGSYSALLTVSDGELGDDDHATVTISNSAPTVSLAAVSGTVVPSGASVAVTGGFSDAGVLDAPWIWTLDWSGSTTGGSTSDQTATIGGSQRLCGAGQRVVTLVVEDKDGDAGTATVAFDVEPAAVQAMIEPGRITLNPKGNGIITLTLFTTPDFDAAAIDPRGVTLGDGEAPEAAVRVLKNGKIKAEVTDVDGDGDDDLRLQFERRTLLDNGDLTSATTALVVGGLSSGGCVEAGATVPVSVTP